MINIRVTREGLVALPALAPYFVLGLLSFLAAPWVLLAGERWLDGGFYRQPVMLAAVHLYALGWGSAVALGALQQMTAVVYATVLHSPRPAQTAFVPYARPEIDAYMRSWWDGQGARNLVEDRKAQREAWFLEEPPDVVFVDADGAMETADIAAVSPTESAAAASSGAAAASPSVVTGSRLGERLVGSGVAAGTASGRVRLLRHPNEGHRLGHGEILVAPSTVDGDAGVVIRTGD